MRILGWLWTAFSLAVYFVIGWVTGWIVWGEIAR